MLREIFFFPKQTQEKIETLSGSITIQVTSSVVKNLPTNKYEDLMVLQTYGRLS